MFKSVLLNRVVLLLMAQNLRLYDVTSDIVSAGLCIDVMVLSPSLCRRGRGSPNFSNTFHVFSEIMS